MTSSQIRVAVAEAVGWKQHREGDWHRGWTAPGDRPPPKGCKSTATLPDYPSDANAAVTLCDILAGEGWVTNLYGSSLGEWTCEFIQPKQASHLHQAPTLAEAICGAFLKCKSLWREEV